MKKGTYGVTTKGGVATLKLLKSMFKFKKGKGKITATFKGEAQVLQSLKQTLREKLVFDGCSPSSIHNFVSLGTLWISYLDARSAKCLKGAFKHFCSILAVSGGGILGNLLLHRTRIRRLSISCFLFFK